MPSSASTLTGLIPTLYVALDTVSRELVGLIPSVSHDAKLERAAKDATITSHVAPAATATDIAPDVNPPDDGNQTIGNITMTISKARRVPVRWQGEESKGLNMPGGPGRKPIMADQFAQAMRTLVNEIEADLAGLHIYASRASVISDTTLFKSGLGDPALVRKILMDNGAPTTDLYMAIGTAEGAALRTLATLNKANEAGTTAAREQGVLLDIHGFKIRESAQIKRPAAGTASGATVGTAAYAVGATVLTLASAGSGTILAGDIITLANDTNRYVVASGDGAVDGGGTITLAAPGLRQAIAGSASPAITVVAQANRNMGFSRSAIVLATRMPALPEEGDSADDRMAITDPVSGLSFEVSLYKQYRQVQYEIALAWGVKAAKAEHIALMPSV